MSQLMGPQISYTKLHLVPEQGSWRQEDSSSLLVRQPSKIQEPQIQ